MLGLEHLYGARLLFQRWASKFITISESTNDQESISFLTGLMAYWEALASFLRDQRLDATAYLSEYNYEKDSRIMPNPWTGIATPVFIYLARVGSIGRQQATLKRMELSSSNPDLKEQFQADLMRHAREIETALMGYRVPSLEKVEETHDEKTPRIHLQKAAQIYRLTALLELYGSFPELLEEHTPQTGQSSGSISYRLDISLSSKFLALATGILTIISSLPLESGTNAIMSFPLIVAGSALQSPYSTAGAAATSQGGALFAEISSIHNEQGLREHWRPFVKTRFKSIHSYVGLAAVSRGLEVVERTWFRADLQNSVSQQSTSVTNKASYFVHWTDVMVDERLETLFG